MKQNSKEDLVPSTNYQVLSTKSKRAQSEMVGFALIVIIVSVIILVFILIQGNKMKVEETNDFEIDNFISSSLEYTTNCSDRSEFLPLRRVIFKCIKNEACQNNVDPCLEMNETLKGIITSSWTASPQGIIKGYEFNITVMGNSFYNFNQGNLTGRSKYSVQSFDSGVNIIFKTYV